MTNKSNITLIVLFMVSLTFNIILGYRSLKTTTIKQTVASSPITDQELDALKIEIERLSNQTYIDENIQYDIKTRKPILNQIQ